jgi:nucleoside-diphosphate-sugar epimerase
MDKNISHLLPELSLLERSNFIPALIRKAVARERPFEVWGSPGVVRDVIYAEDFADAMQQRYKL